MTTSLWKAYEHPWAEPAHLQIEARALGHGVQSRNGGHGGESTDQHKHPPAVKLVGRAHLETPAWYTDDREEESYYGSWS